MTEMFSDNNPSSHERDFIDDALVSVGYNDGSSIVLDSVEARPATRQVHTASNRTLRAVVAHRQIIDPAANKAAPCRRQGCNAAAISARRKTRW